MVNRSTPRAVAVAVQMALSLYAGSALAQSGAAGVEEVTVTARKRAESIQNVDISLSVITAEAIKSLRLRNLPDVAAYAQNVTLFEDFPGSGSPTWFIRGVGLQDFNTNNTPTAGVYVDGNYQVATVMGMTSLYDVAQVEVLKGPQGGLYGRNTSGGAVLVNSNRAVLGLQDAYVELGYGRWDQATAEAMINIPVSANVAWRLAGRVENSSDGWQRVIGTNEKHGEKDRADLRSWLLWQPHEGFTAQWKLQGGFDDSDIALGRSIGFYDPATLASPCAPIREGRRDDVLCTNFGGSNRLRLGLMPENLALQADDGSLVLSDPVNRQSNDYVSTVLDLRWMLGEVELVSISTYDNFGYGASLDLDGSRGQYGHRFSFSDIEVLSQEFRLQSAQDAAFRWMLGVAWSEEEFVERRDFNVPDNVLVMAARQLQPGLGKLLYDQDTSARATYGDLSYAFSPRWSVNASLRYTQEEKKYRNGNFYILSDPPRYLLRDAARDYDLDKPWAGSVSANFSPQENLFLYAKVSQGFKSGGFFGGFPLLAEEVTTYDEETILAWEAGYKQAWPERGLNLAAAAFLYDYKAVQGFVNQINAITGTATDILTNQGDARHTGIEVDLAWQPVEPFSVVAGLGWLNAEYRGVTVLTTNVLRQPVPIRGTRPYAPEWNANISGKYRHNIATDKTLEWVLGYHYRSEFAGSQPSLADAAINQLPGYGVVDFSATLKKNGGPWDLVFWVKNLTDKTYRTRAKSDGVNSYVEFFGEPRSFGVTALYQFRGRQ